MTVAAREFSAPDPDAEIIGQSVREPECFATVFDRYYAVRSAALRALATIPNVVNLGAVDGGQALRITFAPPPADKFPGGKLPPGAGQLTVVINPDTATLVSYTDYGGTTKILAAGWTDDLPEIIPHR